jgi:UDP-N-acetylmuramate dehydrogenase
MFEIIDFKKYSSLNIGGKYKVKIINDIGEYKQYKIIGGANNLLISNKPPKMAMLGDEFNYIFQKNGKLIIGGSTTTTTILNYCRKNDITNFELLVKLPGKIGGLVKMNAGLKKYEIFNHLESIKTYKGVVLKENILYKYRFTDIQDIVFEATFNIEKGFNKYKQKEFIKMRDNQPNLPSAGSCFKNPKDYSAGYLIEKVGLKGYNIGNIAFSSIHSNFLVNMGGGTYDEAIKLINLAKKKVKDEFNIELELEIIIL